MLSHLAHRRLVSANRGGFTLIEMLVATTLVVMMMLMFAQIYVTAIGSLGEQQAIARNDSRARLADTLIRGDLLRGSYKVEPGSQNGIVPLVRDDVVQPWQEGYFYLSENDPNSSEDDVLQLTTFVPRVVKGNRGVNNSVYYGRCLPVPNLYYDATPVAPNEFANHPDLDDSVEDQVGASRAAEVSYFVRNGNLYRRVLLLRDPDVSGDVTYDSSQPSRLETGAPPNFPRTVEYTNQINAATAADLSFYKAFDYAAYCRASATDPTDPTLDIVRFLGVDALKNQVDVAESIGRSFTRFGFAHNAANQYSALPALPMGQFRAFPQLVPPINDYSLYPAFWSIVRSRGLPVEYDSTGTFIGRPTHWETSNFNWKWPGTRTNPLSTALTYNTQTQELRSGATLLQDSTASTRISEDLLLPNVEAFDVEVWDPGIGGWVQLGGPTPALPPFGYFRAAMRTNSGYGPGEDANGNNVLDGGEDRNGNGVLDHSNVFDTGHPDMWSDNPAQGNLLAPALSSLVRPPMRPLLYRFTEDFNGNGMFDVMTEDYNGDTNWNQAVAPTQNVRYWLPNTTYQSGQVVLRQSYSPTAGYTNADSTLSIAYRCISSGEDQDGDRYLDVGETDANMNTNLDADEDVNRNGKWDTASEDLDSDNTIDWGSSGSVSPVWPTIVGQTIQDGKLKWQAFDNRVGLQKIRITLRFRDGTEDLPRQISIVHSFINSNN